MRGLVVAIAAASALPGCLMTRYLAQAVHGQFELLGKARTIEQVVRDPDTPLRVAMQLAEIPEILERVLVGTAAGSPHIE